MKIAPSLLLAAAIALTSLGSTSWGLTSMGLTSLDQSSPAQSGKTATSSATTPDAAATATADPELNAFLADVQSMAFRADGNVARLRIDRWKIDAASKQQSTATATSIRRNLTEAVPDLIQRIQAAPLSMNANFRLYRDLNALYDTFSSLAESAAAFGPREQYDLLASDLAQLDRLRRQAADRLDLLAASNDAELARLRSSAKPGAASKSGKKSNKVVVDDNAPASHKKQPSQ